MVKALSFVITFGMRYDFELLFLQPTPFLSSQVLVNMNGLH